MGKGKPTEDQIYDALYSHIQKGSLLVHDQFHGHEKLVKAIGGGEIAVNSKNPMAFFYTWIGTFLSGFIPWGTP